MTPFFSLPFSHSVVSNSFVTPRTVAHQASLSMGFPRQEYWSELLFPSPADLPDPGIEPASPALAEGFFTTEQPRKPETILEPRFSHKKLYMWLLVRHA